MIRMKTQQDFDFIMFLEVWVKYACDIYQFANFVYVFTASAQCDHFGGKEL